jgi:hypothetical protein
VSWAVAGSQTRTVPLRLALASWRPSGENATPHATLVLQRQPNDSADRRSEQSVATRRLSEVVDRVRA